MPLPIDLKFFPALREVCDCAELQALRARNEERLQRAKHTDGNVFRLTPHFSDTDEYPRHEA